MKGSGSDAEDFGQEDRGRDDRAALQASEWTQRDHHPSGAGSGSGAGTVTVAKAPQRRRLQAHEKLLKKFSYAKALDAALASRQPATVVALMQEVGPVSLGFSIASD